MTVLADIIKIGGDLAQRGGEIYLGKKELQYNAAAAAAVTPQGTNAVNIDGAPVGDSQVVSGVSNRSLLLGGGTLLLAATLITGFALASD